MQQPLLAPDPFALLMYPEAVIAAMQNSDRLSRLKSRICRPLDKPQLPRATTEAAAHDIAEEAAEDRLNFE